MRIRIWNAYASNNSGSYTLVGQFASAEAAAALAERIADVVAAHHAWRSADEAARAGEAPLHRLAREEGLTFGETTGLAYCDDWPDHGPPPAVAVAGTQLLFHVPYTVTMPDLFAELIQRHGGRIALELDHAHHPLVFVFELWWSGMQRWTDDERAEAARRYAAARAEIAAGTLDEAHAPPPWSNEPPRRPAFLDGDFGELRVACAPTDPIAAVASMRALAERHELGVRFQLHEALSADEDPIAWLRGPRLKPGRYDVILSSAGDDDTAVLRALRETTALGLTAVKVLVRHAPIEVVQGVDAATATRVVQALVDAGAKAEAVETRATAT